MERGGRGKERDGEGRRRSGRRAEREGGSDVNKGGRGIRRGREGQSEDEVATGWEVGREQQHPWRGTVGEAKGREWETKKGKEQGRARWRRPPWEGNGKSGMEMA